MTVKIVRTYARPVSEYEQEIMKKVVATMEVAPARLSTEEEVLAFSRDADAAISVREPFTRYVIERLEKCRILATIGVGYQDIDVEAATDCGVLVVNNPDYCLEEVSDHAMALLLSLARKIPFLDKAVRARVGTTEPTTLAQARGRVFRLRGLTLGLIGFGGIPQTLVPKARGFGFRIIAHDPFIPAEVAKKAGVELVSLDQLLEESDFISVHAALTPKNKGMFGLEQFKKMKPTAFLINTARGGLVDEEALATALTKGYLAGAGLDVTEPEPPHPDNPLLKFENVLLTGHSAMYSETSMVAQGKGPIEEIARVFSGEWPRPRALKNPEVKEKYIQRWGAPTARLA